MLLHFCYSNDCSKLFLKFRLNNVLKYLFFKSIGNAFHFTALCLIDFCATVCKTVHPMLSDRCLSVCPVCDVGMYCGQTVGWIKMKLGAQVSLSPGHIVLDGDPASPPQKGDTVFGPFLSWPNCWMHQDATWYGVRPQPRRLCVRWGPSSSPQEGGGAPNFRPMFIVAKRLDGSRWYLAWR